jgi:hypothetical protein
MQAKRTLIALVILTLLLPSIVHSEAVSRVHYMLVYDPFENTGILIVNMTINLPDCNYVVVPINIFGEDSKLTLLNYTVSEDLVISGVEYSEENKSLIILACGNGEISALFTATNIFSESGLGAYINSVDTTPLRELGSVVIVEIKITGKYNVNITPVEVNYNVESTAESTNIIINGYGQAYITLYSTIEIPETPTTTPTTTPTQTPIETTSITPTRTPPYSTTTPQTPPEKIPSLVILGVLIAVFIIIVLIMLLVKRKRT